jgi:hypothetical protein
MANRPRGIRLDRSVSLPMSRHALRPTNAIFRSATNSRKSHSARRSSSHVVVKAANPILSPPSLSSITFARSENVVEVETASTPTALTVYSGSNFPSPLPRLDFGTANALSILASKFVPSANVKKLLLSAVPGFFGLMGLGQLSEKRSKRGMFFLAAGAALSTLSSWYTILPERIYSFVTGTTALPPYALSWMSRITGYNTGLGEACVILLAFVPALWALQVYDSISPITATVATGRSLAAAGQGSPRVPASSIRSSENPRASAEASVSKFAKDLRKTSSLFSYLWER